jgi:hypothetical protein
MKQPDSKQSRLMRQIGNVARRKGLPNPITLKEVKRAQSLDRR